MRRITLHWPLALSILAVALLGTGCTRQLRKARHLSRGEKAYNAQKFDEAEIEFLKVLQVVPGQPEAIRYLGLIYEQEGNLLRAGYFLRNAIQIHPNDSEVRLKLAQNQLELGDGSNCVVNARLVLAKEPGKSEALELIAISSLSTNGTQDVQEEIRRLQQRDKDRAGYHVAYGTLALRRQDFTNAESQFKQALALDPKSTSALLGLGGIYAARNDLSAADEALKTAASLAPVRAGPRLKYANFKFLIGKSEEAKTMAQQITTEAPDYLPAWILQAQVAFKDKRYDEAEQLLQRVLSRDPVNLDASMLYGNMKLVQGDATKALATFAKLNGLYTHSPQIAFQMARAHLLNKDVPNAIVALNRALAVAPNFADAAVLLANLKMRTGETGDAITILTNLLKREPRVLQAYLLLTEAYLVKSDTAMALSVCADMVKQFPDNADVHLVYGSMLLRAGQSADARGEFQKALSIAPNHLGATEQLVDLDIAEKQYSNAVQLVQARIDKTPSAPGPWILMGRTRLAEAEAALNDANKDRAPNTPSARVSDSEAASSQVKLAEAAFLKAIELDPAGPTAYLMLSQLYTAAGKPEQALGQLNQLLAKTNNAAAWMRVGVLQETLTNYPAAAEAYEKTIAAEPNSILALNNLAYLYSERLGQQDKALSLAKKAHELAPANSATGDTLGWVYYQSEDYVRALPLFEESAAKVPNEPEIQLHLGLTEYMVGDEDAARTALERALQSSKTFPEKETARRRLAILAINPKTADSASIAMLESCLKQTPNDSIALSRLGAIQERDGHPEKAVVSYEQALKYAPQNPELTLKVARLYSAPPLNNPEKALAAAKAAHERFPQDSQISAFLGHLVYQSGNPKWAASLLEEGIRNNPDDPQVSFDLAWSHYSIGRVSEAVERMQNLADSGTNGSLGQDAKRFLAYVAATDDPSKAVAMAGEAQNAVRQDPHFLPGLMILAVADDSEGKHSEALVQYNQILSQFPQFAPAMRNVGLLYFGPLKDPERAYDLLTKSREVFPKDPRIAKALGILTYRKGNYSRAAQLLKESTQSSNTDPEALYYLGMAQYQLKSKPESKASLQQALDLGLRAELASDAKRVLGELK